MPGEPAPIDSTVNGLHASCVSACERHLIALGLVTVVGMTIITPGTAH
jgi:hypothetical protein